MFNTHENTKAITQNNDTIKSDFQEYILLGDLFVGIRRTGVLYQIEQIEVVVAAGTSEAPYDLAGVYVWDIGTFGANISWSYGEPAETEFDYDNGTDAGSIGEGDSGLPMWWGIMIPAADLANYAGATLTTVSNYEAPDYTGTCTIFIQQGGDNATGEVV